MHKPVLLVQVLEAFKNKKLTHFIDGTLGFGGHAQALLHAHPELKLLFGIDQDFSALILAKERLSIFGERVHFVHGNFRNQKDLAKVDGILLDLGVSSMQLDQAERGFSFNKEGPLDMRMNSHSSLDAYTIINGYPEKEIARILFEYGEVRGSRRIAKAIIEARKKKKITTTKELSDLLMPLIGYRPKHLHPMTLIFQGLRIAVNDELGALREGLETVFSQLHPGGRMCVISFHSLEDRIVKYFFREKGQKEAIILTKKPLVAEEDELRDNPRARSAKLRVIEKR